jgi:Na+/melibiose symporter-like transporter
MNINPQKLSVTEKIGYSLGDLAANLVFQTLMTYLAYFYTDIYGLEAKHASAIILTVGLVAAFAFNPIIGALADRTNTKWGKFRPWILWTAVPLGAVALFAFSTPDFSYKSKVIYAIITYTLLLLLYAANNLPYSALSGVITIYEREKQYVGLPVCCRNVCSIFCTGIHAAHHYFCRTWG